jgi:AbrB family looped-hinge helix DNA binding protein
MTSPTTVKVSKRHQIVVPAEARIQLNIHSGDRLLVDIQDGMLILIPQPENYTERLAGLHQEIWTDVDAQDYIDQERDAWPPSSSI